MRLSSGRWVSGDDFIDRTAELHSLESHVQDRNHILLSGQRRMGKTSIVRELGRRLQAQGWRPKAGFFSSRTSRAPLAPKTWSQQSQRLCILFVQSHRVSQRR